MEFPLFALIIAAIAGMAMALQGSFNAILGKIIGTLETTLVVHLIGIAVVIIALFLFKLGTGNLALIKNAPWYTFLGGCSVCSLFSELPSASPVPVWPTPPPPLLPASCSQL